MTSTATAAVSFACEFAAAAAFGLGCFVLGILVTLAVQAAAGLNDGETRR